MTTGRGIDAALQAELERHGALPVLLLEIALDEADGGPVRIWTGTEPLTWNGASFGGVGDFAGLVEIDERLGEDAPAAVYTFSGIDTTGAELEGFRAAANADLSVNISGRSVRLWVGALDEAGALVGTPHLLRDDLGDSLSLVDETEAGLLNLVLTCQAPGSDFRRMRRRTYTPADHEAIYGSADTFFRKDGDERKRQPWGETEAAV